MILKILNSDKESWWVYDNLQKVRYSVGAGEFILVANIIGESSAGMKEYDYRIVCISDMNLNLNDIMNKEYQWFRDNTVDIAPNLVVLDDKEIKNGVNFVNWVIARQGEEEKIFFFNTLGFLLNDDGKTIEKISC